MTAAEVIVLRDRDWMPQQPWSCPAGHLVTAAGTDRASWLDARRAGIGASDVAALFGVSNWSTPWDLWAEKTGRVQPEPENEAQLRGRVLEHAIAEVWTKLRPADDPVRLRRQGLMKHRIHGHIRATVDRLSVCRAGRCVTEVKTAGSLAEWDGDEVPVAYQLQTQQQLYVTGRAHVHVVVLGPRFEMLERTIDRDDDLIARMVEQINAWWQRHVIEDVEPDATAGAADGLARLYGDADPDATVELPAPLWGVREQIRALSAQIADLEEQRDDLTVRVKQAAGNASVIKAAGGLVATWKPTKKVAGATAAWRKANPDLVERYSEPVTTDVLDVDRMVTEHPELIGNGQPLYRVRQLRWAN